MLKRTVDFLTVVWCVAACGWQPSQQEFFETLQSERVAVGSARELRLEQPAGAGVARPRSEAVAAWRAAPGEEEALALARAYFPEYAGAVEEDSAWREGPAGARQPLRARLPAGAGEAMELEVWGQRFRVRQEHPEGEVAVLEQEQEAAFYGRTHFWAPAGRAQVDEVGRWVTQRVEEYWVLEEGAPEHRERFEVEVPEQVVMVRDAGEYLEFWDASGVPVLRMHYVVARDAQGLSRQGRVVLQGVKAEPLPTDGLARYALTGRTLRVEMAVDLAGMKGPIVVDPGWSSTASMTRARYQHTATLLPDGRVLVAAGYSGGMTSSTELYDPTTGTWSGTGFMRTGRYQHAATLLPNGKVLVTGGVDSSNSWISSAELYDPATGGWSPVDAMAYTRAGHTATLLLNGLVLVAGGQTPSELFDPITGTWRGTGGHNYGRLFHTATLLPDGRVLVTGGHNGAAMSSAELYDPATGRWSTTGSMSTSRYHHTATLLPNGRVLAVGGYSNIASTELYDPETGRWSSTGSLGEGRLYHTSTLLPNGTVLITGGYYYSTNWYTRNSAELYNPGSGSWSSAGTLAYRYFHTATLLPNGKVLLAGGLYGSSTLSSVELYELGTGGWQGAASMPVARAGFALSLLPSGRVLASGGRSESSPVATAATYDQIQNRWESTGSMSVARMNHTLTLLPNGRVLAVGGSDGSTSLAAAEVYDSSSGLWSAGGTMVEARSEHTATLLHTGQVLVVGGRGSERVLASVELYDPLTGTWRATGSMASMRASHTATLLADGKVLVLGGTNGGASLTTAEVYDPLTGTWSNAPAMSAARASHTATLMLNGRVLVAGGTNGSSSHSHAEMYDPVARQWSAVDAMDLPRSLHTATLLPSGRVLVTGGTGGSGNIYAAAEMYDPHEDQWSTVTSMGTTRMNHRALLLPSGMALVAGGENSASVASALLFNDRWSGDAWRPIISQPQVLRAGIATTLSGSGFRGISQAGGGNFSDSPSDIPMPSLWNLEGHQVARMRGSELQSRTSVKVQVPNVPPGHYLLFVTVNGIAGGRMVRVIQGNQAPVAQAVSRATARRKPVSVPLQASDADGDPLTYAVVTAPANGTLSGSGANLVYTPRANFAGSDSFTYKVSDGSSDSNLATVSLWVSNSAPAVQPLSFFLFKNRVGTVTLSATDAEGDTLTYTVVTQPAQGTLSGTAPGLLYTPRTGFVGTDTFTFKAGDGLAESQPVTVTLWVFNAVPAARALTVQTSVDTPAAVTLQAMDSDGDPLGYAVVTAPAHGTLSGAPPALLYTPEPGYVGADSFTYKANDGANDSRVATVTIEVSAGAQAAAPTVPIISEGSSVVQADGSMELTWQASQVPTGQAVLYRVEVSRDGAIVSVLSSVSPGVTVPPGLAPGRYQWRVEAVDAYGRSSGFSQSQEFIITSEGQPLVPQEPQAAGCSATGGGTGPGSMLLGLILLATLLRRRCKV